MRDIDQPRPFDLDEERSNSPLTSMEQCEADWMREHGKTLQTMTPEDVAALRLACPLYGAAVEHSERRR